MNQLNTYTLITFILIALTFTPKVMAKGSVDHAAIQNLLVDEANRQGVDPALALAIAYVESNFNPQALSKAGAKGVMQIMPATAENVFGVSRDQLYDEKINIFLGITFIKKLLTRYNQRIDIALSHYNGGSAVQNGSGRLSVIPATQKYVDKVLSAREQYKYKAYQLSNSLSAQNTIKPAKQYSTATFEQSLYQKVEQLRSLRLHNIMRNTQKAMKSTTQSIFQSTSHNRHQSNTDSSTIINSQKHRLKARVNNAPKKIITLSEKRKKVLSWESIFN